MENQGTFSNDMSKQSTGNSFVKAVIMVLASQKTHGMTFMYWVATLCPALVSWFLEMQRWIRTVPVFKELWVQVLGSWQSLLSKEELLPTVPFYSVTFHISLPFMFFLQFCKYLPLGSSEIHWSLWASLSSRSPWILRISTPVLYVDFIG